MLAAMLASAQAVAAPRNYLLPDETAAFVEGPDVDVAQGNCGACHSSDYIATQPRGLPNPQAFWNAEVVKMQKVYGAPIEDGDVAKIVGYLVQAYGK
jgi:hypothetical protein